MITFNNSLDAAARSVHLWDKKSLLSEVTLVRDVYGKISFLMENVELIDDPAKQNLDHILNENVRNLLKVGKRVERIDLYARLHENKENLHREICRLAGVHVLGTRRNHSTVVVCGAGVSRWSTKTFEDVTGHP